MNDCLKVGRIVWSGGISYAGEGNSPNPLEYAPKGTLKELEEAQARITELENLILLTLSPGWGCMTDVDEFKKKAREVV